MNKFIFEINYSNGPIPFEIKKKYINDDESVKYIEIISPKELYLLDIDQFMYYYNLHAFFLHNMCDDLTNINASFELIQNTYYKIAKLAKSFVELKYILDVNQNGA